MKLKEKKKVKRVKRVTTIEKEKIVRWTVDNKENWRLKWTTEKLKR